MNSYSNHMIQGVPESQYYVIYWTKISEPWIMSASYTNAIINKWANIGAVFWATVYYSIHSVFYPLRLLYLSVLVLSGFPAIATAKIWCIQVTTTGTCTKKGCNVVGKLIVEIALAWTQLGASNPWDGGSAKLSAEGTYKEEIHKLYCAKRRVIHCNTAFCSGLQDFPPSIAWITPWLSDLMRKWVFE